MYDNYIRYHALIRPYAVAVATLQREITFREFDRDIDRIAAALADAGVSGARLAAVDASHPYLHALLLLGLTRLGVGSLSLTKAVVEHVAATLAPDIMITDSADRARTWTGGPALHVSADWLANALAAEPRLASRARLDMDAVGRITLTSGTTGRPKAMARTWRQIDTVLAQRMVLASAWKSARPERLITLVGFDTGFIFLVLANWATGGALVTAGPETFREEADFQKLAPTTLLAAPAQLQSIVARLPADFMPKPDLTILTGGSHLPPSLAEALQIRLTPSIWNKYGSSEADAVAMAPVARLRGDPTAAGWLVPNAEVEAVDEDDRALPFGRPGAIRLRTPSLVEGYLDDDEANTHQFSAGWFYPGDFGSVSADGWLRIEGRLDEVMNFGGIKVMPQSIEAAVLACPGVADVAAFAAPSSTGLHTPWLAIVRGEGFDEALVGAALKPMSLPTVQMAWIQQIPRNERGKVLRDRLRAAVMKPSPGAIEGRA